MDLKRASKPSSYSQTAQLTRLAQRVIRDTMSRKTRVSKASIEAFLRNLEWVIHGIRPAFSPEGIALPDDALLKLIQEMAAVIDRTSSPDEMLILSIDGHKFIGRLKFCKTHLESFVGNGHLDCVFVDISKTQSPKVVDYKELTSIHKAIQNCLNSLSKVTQHNNIVSVLMAEEHNTNLCTLFGCILGYPVIYYFEGNNYLNMVPLNVIKIVSRENGLEGSGNQLLSFSYPVGLEGAKLAVETWCSKLKEDKTVAVIQETVQMPYVVL